MARTQLTAQSPTAAGIALAFAAANVDGHSFYNTERTMLYVKNGGAASINVTLQTPGIVDGNAVADRVIAVAAGAERLIGRISDAAYNRGDNTVYVDFSAITSVTVALIEP